MKKKIENFLVLLVLAMTGALSVATSSSDSTNPNLTYVDYSVATNCPNATLRTGTITVSSDGQITYPLGIDFTNVGLSTRMLLIASQTTVTGVVNNVVRTCTYSLETSYYGNYHLYTCTEDGAYVCRTSFTHW